MNMECVGNANGLHSGVGGDHVHHFMDTKVEMLAQKRVRELQNAMPPPPHPNCEEKDQNEATNAAKATAASQPRVLKFPDSTKNYASGMVRTPKTDFFERLDLGVPMDLPKEYDSEVLVLYNRQQAIPKHYNDPSLLDGAKADAGDNDTTDSSQPSSQIPSMGTEDALKNCEIVNVVLANHDRRQNICTAIVPQYESFHIQKWMRIGYGGKPLDKKQDLRLVSRGMGNNGREQFLPPAKKDHQESWQMLSQYYKHFEAATDVLKPLVQKVATKHKTVTIMVSNFGQSELLANFVCSAKSRNMDLSSVLVFATDLETKELAESLGLTAFYDKWNFEAIPSEAANRYGDRLFTLMMMAKVMCVHMVSSLGYNILFQDVDMVWYKNPIPFFEEKGKLQGFDMMFQDDGGHSGRYLPYSANSGFYYVRNNPRTVHFFSALLNSVDLVLKTDSHQQALIAVMNEHVSLFGLKVKVFSRDTDEFPGGWHYHQKTGKYVRRMLSGTADPYIFHMSWTMNKDNKLLFLQQLGEWYVKDECVHKKPSELDFVVEDSSSPFADECCAAEPIIECHYRDKPSKIPCYDSPPIDKNGKSWWLPNNKLY